ncbi:MAG: WYL domain-containing protein [Bacteroidales bacterium]|nr:WYL domain-containing protein [Bacteroidales bacterium]
MKYRGLSRYVYYPENNYINEVKLHKSQVQIGEGVDYTDYKLHLRPTRDFLQELLWHGRKLTVISPDSLRQEMITILKDMTESYTTGKNTVEE